MSMKKNKFHSKGSVALPVPEGMLMTMKSGKTNADAQNKVRQHWQVKEVNKYIVVREGDKCLNVHIFSKGKELEVIHLDVRSTLNLIKDLSDKLNKSV